MYSCISLLSERMIQQPRRLARSGVQRGIHQQQQQQSQQQQPRRGQRTFRPYNNALQATRKKHFWSGKLSLLIYLAAFLVGYRLFRLYQFYIQETTQKNKTSSPSF
ncbi:hypothetical protein BX616_003681 [Lobosporangium transversale]|nr:hypothetical protein BX616_003681 [Lobosporangium transversale]